MRNTLLLVVASASLMLAACERPAGTTAASKPASSPAAAAPGVVVPEDSCKVLAAKTIPYDDMQEPLRWLRSEKTIREMPSLDVFFTDAPTTITKLRRVGTSDCHGHERVVFPACSTLQIMAASAGQGALTLTDGSTTMIDQLAVTPHKGKTGIDFLQSAAWADPRTGHTYTFYVYFQDANDAANKQLKKHYLLEAFDSDGSCDDRRPDRNGNITDAPDPSRAMGQETDTTHGHEGNP
jgi:hypothetical protein